MGTSFGFGFAITERIYVVIKTPFLEASLGTKRSTSKSTPIVVTKYSLPSYFVSFYFL
jgi:hypothetical protein